jgi:rubrerythrin
VEETSTLNPRQQIEFDLLFEGYVCPECLRTDTEEGDGEICPICGFRE